ncbi:MAG: hypothetical protein JXR65_12780 [Bacteroidales bacterium]|nr:hypothetical protein [Bacteroidales bacterium]
MGKGKQGIYGAYNGRVGNVVGSVRNGTQVLSIRPASMRNPRTDAQQNTRMRFAMLGKFLSSQRSAVKVGFESLAVDNVSAVNAAMQANFHTAFTGDYPDLALDFSKVRLSSGDLLIPEGMTVTGEAGAAISLAWNDNSALTQGNAQDNLIIGLYNEELKRGQVLFGKFRRSDVSGTVQLPVSWAGQTLHVLAFCSWGADPSDVAEGYNVSDTVYAGSVTLLP